MKMKFKYLFLLILGIGIFSCSDDDNSNEIDHDPVAQALIDDEILIEFLKTHYLTPEKEIDTIMNGETPLYDIVTTDEVEYNDIDYKMYYYVDQVGVGQQATRNDSVQILYRGFLLDSIKFDDSKRKSFWDYALDPEMAHKQGIKNAQIEAPGTMFIPGVIYTIHIEHAFCTYKYLQNIETTSRQCVTVCYNDGVDQYPFSSTPFND